MNWATREKNRAGFSKKLSEIKGVWKMESNRGRLEDNWKRKKWIIFLMLDDNFELNCIAILTEESFSLKKVFYWRIFFSIGKHYNCRKFLNWKKSFIFFEKNFQMYFVVKIYLPLLIDINYFLFLIQFS